MQLRELDLASSPALVKEWTTLIAELDVVLRLNRGYVAQVRQARRRRHHHQSRSGADDADAGGHRHGYGTGTGTGDGSRGDGSGRGSGRRRSNSFLAPSRNVAPPQFELPREAQAAAGAGPQRRPRATSFNFGDVQTLEPDGAENAKEKVARWQNEAQELAKEESFASPLDYHGNQSASDYLAEQQQKLARARAVAQQLLDDEEGGGGGKDVLSTGTLTLSSLEAHDRKMQQEHLGEPQTNPELMFDRSSGGVRSRGGSRGGSDRGGDGAGSRNGLRHDGVNNGSRNGSRHGTSSTRHTGGGDASSSRRRSASFHNMPPAPAPDGDVAALYKWSWEQPGQLNPSDYTKDPLAAKARGAGGGGNGDGGGMLDDNPYDDEDDDGGRGAGNWGGSDFSGSRHSGSISRRSASRSERSRRSASRDVSKSPSNPHRRSSSVPLRRADGALYKVFIPVNPE